jgi:2-phosphoglycerate kinase
MQVAPERPAMENHEVSNLDHVRWVGGGSGAGKTTVTRMLSNQFGVHHYSVDAMFSLHGERLRATAAPLFERFRQMSSDERWVQRDPVAMYHTFPWFHGEGFSLIIDDLKQMPTDRPILVEGFRLVPHLVRPYLSNPSHAVWLVPTSEFRRAAFGRRRDADAFWMETSDPGRALANVLERDRLFSDEIVRDAAGSQLETLHIDGTQTVDSIVLELAARFGLARTAL